MAINLEEKLGIKDFNVIVEETLQSIIDSGVGITNTSVGSVTRTIVEAILDNADAMNFYISYVYSAMGIDSATSDDLDRLVLILGIVRNKATNAVGTVTFSTGDEPYVYDIPIPYGSEISTRQLSDGSIYTFITTDEDVVLRAGETSIDVNVMAVNSGHLYLPAGSLCVMGKSIIGISTVQNDEEINSGKDQESDEDLRSRTKEYAKTFGKCTDNALKVAVESVNGVINCTVIDQYKGLGTSGIIVVSEIMPPPQDVQDNINAVVQDTKACGVKVFIVYPEIKNISIDLTITESVDADAVLEAISNYVNSLRVGQTFVIKQMERKVLNAIDVNTIENDDIDISTTMPDGNVTCTNEEIIRVDSITVNGVRYDV